MYAFEKMVDEIWLLCSSRTPDSLRDGGLDGIHTYAYVQFTESDDIRNNCLRNLPTALEGSSVET